MLNFVLAASLNWSAVLVLAEAWLPVVEEITFVLGMLAAEFVAAVNDEDTELRLGDVVVNSVIVTLLEVGVSPDVEVCELVAKSEVAAWLTGRELVA